MKRIILFLSLLAAASFGVLRAEVYTISCIAADGYVGLGSQHGATPYIFYVGASEVSEDGYWEVTEAANGTTFRNQATGQYLAFTTERNGNIVKYMTLSSSAASDNELWTLEAQTDGTFVIRSVADPSYVWDLRRDG
ncbi:MAG: RICIN domain-containing protein, partial [Alloprevotella sp.]|nr:RICIN domain-containing protein [Alloprevotella sp.]